MSHRDQQSATPDSLQLVCFCVGDEEYGIDIMRVREVVPALPITRVADAPAFLEGITELRGAFFGVIDLRKRLRKRLRSRPGAVAPGTVAPAVTPQQRYVVVRLHGRSLGLVVDGVTEVRRIEPGRVAPLAASVPGAGRLLAGVARLDHGVVLVMDLDHLLTAAEQESLSVA
jgi:purine-binding chemotaxis protein CheW